MDPVSLAIGAGSSLAGKLLDARTSRKAAKMNIKMQREFAQHGIRWKVEDAKAAGLHPLAALGAQTTSFQPVNIGSDFGSIGQDITRAMDATRTAQERGSAESVALAKLSLERAGLQNELLRTQIARLKTSQNPSMASVGERYLVEGQPASGLVNTKPMERQASDPAQRGQEAGAIADIGWTRSPSGRYYPIPSKDFADRAQDNIIAQGMHGFRSYFQLGERPGPPFKAPPGQYWTGGPVIGYKLAPGGLEGLRNRRR